MISDDFGEFTHLLSFFHPKVVLFFGKIHRSRLPREICSTSEALNDELLGERFTLRRHKAQLKRSWQRWKRRQGMHGDAMLPCLGMKLVV